MFPIEFVAIVKGVLGVVGDVGRVLLGCSVGLQFDSFLPMSQASCWSPEKKYLVNTELIGKAPT